jgi:secreted Zn-dependent insulinase-like peptidase
MKGIWWPVFEKMQFLDDVTHKQMNDFSTLFRSHMTLNMLVAGNMTSKVIGFYCGRSASSVLSAALAAQTVFFPSM